jgi:hypothetical protein
VINGDIHLKEAELTSALQNPKTAMGRITTERGSVPELVPIVIAAVLYLGVVGSALAFVGWYWLLTKATATNSSLIFFVTPIVALVLGWLMLQEQIELIVALGTFLILSGVYVTVKQGSLRKLGGSKNLGKPSENLKAPLDASRSS